MSDTGHRSDTVTADGLFVREFNPSHTPRGAFLLLHGMESHSGWFQHVAARLVGDGWAVVAFDRAGWGKSPGRRGHLASYRHFVENAARIASNARERYGPVHLAGMSWGGMAALYLGLRRGWLFDSIALMAPGIVTKREIPFASKCGVAIDVLRGRGDSMVDAALEPEHFTRDPQWQKFIADDADRIRSVSTSFCFETLKMRRFIRENAGRRLLPPTVCLLAGDDTVIDNTATADICARAGAMIESIPDIHHTLIFEKPEQTATILSTHAAGAEASRARPPGKAWVIGAGAVGGAVASLMSFGGVEVGVLVKPKYLAQLAGNGFTLRSGNAIRNTHPALRFADAPELLPDNPELVIVAVKSFDTDAALSGLIGHIPANSVVASLQNGIGNEERIAAAFPDNTVVAASICASLELTGPGAALWADDRGGLGAALHQGDYDLASATWTNLLERTGMECAWFSGDKACHRLKWSKLMLNTGFNALNSVTGKTSAELLRDDTYGPLAVAALREGFAVMDHLRLQPFDLPGVAVSKLRFLVTAFPRLSRRIMAWQAGRSAEAAFSMRQDVLHQRQRTEIQELNGKIVEIGHKAGIATSANEKLVAMVNNLS